MNEFIFWLIIAAACFVVGYVIGQGDGKRDQNHECNRRLIRAYDEGVKRGRKMEGEQ